jgi:hypothetical protein
MKRLDHEHHRYGLEDMQQQFHSQKGRHSIVDGQHGDTTSTRVKNSEKLKKANQQQQLLM